MQIFKPIADEDAKEKLLQATSTELTDVAESEINGRCLTARTLSLALASLTFPAQNLTSKSQTLRSVEIGIVIGMRRYSGERI